MKRLVTAVVLAAGLAAAALVTPAAAQHSGPYCGITWGSLAKTGTSPAADPLVDVRAGRHDCYDRLVIDVDGGAPGYRVQYVTAVHAQGSGNVVPLRGGAFLQIDALIPASDPATGTPTYTPANPRELVDVAGYRTFRQAAWGGSFEGQTTVGVGVRARLPFRVLVLTGPGADSRLVIDVAHQW